MLVASMHCKKKTPKPTSTATEFPSPLHLISFLLHNPLLPPTNFPHPLIGSSQNLSGIRGKIFDYFFTRNSVNKLAIFFKFKVNNVKLLQHQELKLHVVMARPLSFKGAHKALVAKL